MFLKISNNWKLHQPSDDISNLRFIDFLEMLWFYEHSAQYSAFSKYTLLQCSIGIKYLLHTFAWLFFTANFLKGFFNAVLVCELCQGICTIKFRNSKKKLLTTFYFFT